MTVQMQAVGDGEVAATFVIDHLPLLSGEYCLEVWLIDAGGVHVYDSRECCCHFRAGRTAARGPWCGCRTVGKAHEVADALAS